MATANGRLQVTFHGQALYRFDGDSKKGRAKGQGVEGAWFAELASNRIKTTSLPAAASNSTTPAATTTPPRPTTTTTTAPPPGGGGIGF